MCAESNANEREQQNFPTSKTQRLRSKVKTLLLQRCALRKFHVTDDQNTRDQITIDRRAKRA